jgi:hypothetical protein
VIWQKIQIVLVYYKNKWKDCAKDWAVLRYYECYGGTIDRTVHKNTHATRNSTLLESVDWSVVSRPRPSANYSTVAMVPKRWSIACKAANEYIISFQWIHNGVKCIGRCKRQEQSRYSPLHRSVPTGIASWLTWRRTRSLQLLRLVSRQTNNLGCSNQEIDKISVPGQNPSMLDRGLLDFFSMIDIL